MFVAITAAVLAVIQHDGWQPPLVQPPQEINRLRQFAGNKFDFWQVSPRLDMPVKPTQVEVAPPPRRVGS